MNTVTLTKQNFPFMSIRQACEAAVKIAQVMDHFDEQLHIIACSGLKHYEDSGDLTALSNLVKACSKYDPIDGKFDGRSVRGADLRQWITKHANVKWSKDSHQDVNGKATGGYIKAKTGPAEVKLEEAIAKPFYSYKESTSKELVDVRAVANSAFKRISKAITDGHVAPEQKELASVMLDTLRPFVKKAS